MSEIYESEVSFDYFRREYSILLSISLDLSTVLSELISLPNSTPVACGPVNGSIGGLDPEERERDIWYEYYYRRG